MNTSSETHSNRRVLQSAGRLVRTRAGRAVLTVVLITCSLWLWEAKLEDHFIPKRWGVVEEGRIYRSGQLSSTLVAKMLRKHNISVIIDLTSEMPNDRNQVAEKRAAAQLGVDVYRYPLAGDGTGDIANYAKAIAAIVDAKNRAKTVLVHCAAGAQRTGGVVACYRVLVEARSPSFAYEELVRYGWRDKPNQILLTFINSNMAQLAEMLTQMGVIEHAPQPLPLIPSIHQQEKNNRTATELPRVAGWHVSRILQGAAIVRKCGCQKGEPEQRPTYQDSRFCCIRDAIFVARVPLKTRLKKSQNAIFLFDFAHSADKLLQSIYGMIP